METTITCDVTDNISASSGASSLGMNSPPFIHDVWFGFQNVCNPQSTHEHLPKFKEPLVCFTVTKQDNKVRAGSSCTVENDPSNYQPLSSLSESSVQCTKSEMETPQEYFLHCPGTDASCSSSLAGQSAELENSCTNHHIQQNWNLLGEKMESTLNNLLERNSRLKEEIEDLKRETSKFLRSVFSNPENRHLIVSQSLQSISAGSWDLKVGLPFY